ncbi:MULTISPECIES: hypothetical protein [unclassified Streptomyces]|uniref:hypothetical protein n=1 Tax=unclassified Streptomyces TaxID=2593676 RepID=UPI00224FAA74|nr:MULTISPECIES: hypothetical protein [unclassified Streptomyces]MCX5100149.1 hypothetical protein [Streptomyces sp. NBC_00439]WSC30683.1 hypothetical protein OG902_30570 [Streptomyces sp. NBC_01768]
MSTERPDNDVTGPRRRSPLAVASVAAAVLLAGGGGAYWAATAADGDGRSGSGADDGGRHTPPPLALGQHSGAPTAPGAPPRGIAPGEPDPSGGRVVYRAAGKLPEGPRTAAVRQSVGTVSAAEVARLAKALGLAGTPQAEATYWKVGSDGDGSGPVLRVNKQAPGTWSFARYGSGGTDNCQKGAACSGGNPAPGGSGSPVSESAARAAAAPVLKAAGQPDATLDSGQLMGAVRVVNADPKVDDLPTYGWSTGIQVGPDGEVVGGSGQLKGLEKGDSYPVIGAAEALEQLNGPATRKEARADIGGCASPVPLDEGLKSPKAHCGARTGAERPTTTVTVDKAVFGLAAQYVAGKQTLVPSWLFSVRPAAGGRGTTVTQVAVAPSYLAKNAPATTAPTPPPTPPGNAEKSQRQLLSYSADGRTLSVTFWGGVCSTYTASAAESPDRVTVKVTEAKQPGKKVCVMIAKELTRTVTLDAPLGDRTVVDAVSGGDVPRA